MTSSALIAFTFASVQRPHSASGIYRCPPYDLAVSTLLAYIRQCTCISVLFFLVGGGGQTNTIIMKSHNIACPIRAVH